MVALIGGRRARLPQQLAASSRRLPPIPARPPLQPRWRRFRASLVLCWCQRRLRAAPCNPAVPANQSHPRCRPWRIRLCLQGCRPRHQPVCGHQNHNPHRLRPPGGHASQSCKQCGGGGAELPKTVTDCPDKLAPCALVSAGCSHPRRTHTAVPCRFRQDLERIQQEIAFLSECNHPNVVCSRH